MSQKINWQVVFQVIVSLVLVLLILIFVSNISAGKVPGLEDFGTGNQYAAYSDSQYKLAEITRVISANISTTEGIVTQQVECVILGQETEERLILDFHIDTLSGRDSLVVGNKVVVLETWDTTANTPYYTIIDYYRLDGTVFLLIAFFLLIIFLAAWRGVSSIVGLLFGIVFLLYFIVPRLLLGDDPILISMFGGVIILCVSIYLAHGFSKRTTLAVFSSLLAIVIAALLGTVFISITKLTGVGSEEAVYLGILSEELLSLRGLLFAGIIIGTLGVLDDVTITQVTAIEEIAKADPSLGMKELYQRGLNVGREHVAAMVNTLALAYVGASLPVFLLILVNHTQPLWVTLNNQFVIEEVVRTLAGSMSLVIAVPIATFFAAYMFDRNRKTNWRSWMKVRLFPDFQSD